MIINDEILLSKRSVIDMVNDKINLIIICNIQDIEVSLNSCKKLMRRLLYLAFYLKNHL